MTRQRTAIAVAAAILLALVLAWVFLSPRGDDAGPAVTGDSREVEVAPGDGITLHLYFPGGTGLLLLEEREVAPAAGAALLRAATAEVLAGPEEPNRFAPFPEGTEAGNVYISQTGIAYVDLVSTRPNPPSSGSLDEMLSVYSLVNSLEATLPELEGVVLLWNGQQRPSFAGHLDTGRPLTTDDSLVGGAG